MTNNKTNRKNNLDSNISNIIDNIDSREGIAAVAGELLNLSVPRDRNSNFRSAIMPDAWQRGDASYNEFLHNLILQSYSPNKIKSLLKSLNLPYSISDIEEIKEGMFIKAKELKK